MNLERFCDWFEMRGRRRRRRRRRISVSTGSRAKDPFFVVDVRGTRIALPLTSKYVGNPTARSQENVERDCFFKNFRSEREPFDNCIEVVHGVQHSPALYLIMNTSTMVLQFTVNFTNRDFDASLQVA
jgi:hypothetical protein